MAPETMKGLTMKPMRPELVALFERIKEKFTFDDEATIDDVNATDCDGENALHWAARQNDLAIARLLIEEGINIDQHGDLGYTPLHEACSLGHLEMVRLLVESGADIHARSEGESPFSLARLRGRIEICDFLRPLLTKQVEDPHFWTKVKIDLLRREIARLEKLLT